jgi:hypothetical protein
MVLKLAKAWMNVFRHWLQINIIIRSRYSSLAMALGYELDDRGSRVRFPEGAGNFSLHRRVQNGSGAHPASYPMGSRGSFPGGKAAGAQSWPLTSNYCRGRRMSGAIFPLPNTPSWRGDQLKTQGQLYFTFTFKYYYQVRGFRQDIHLT